MRTGIHLTEKKCRTITVVVNTIGDSGDWLFEGVCVEKNGGHTIDVELKGVSGSGGMFEVDCVERVGDWTGDVELEGVTVTV